MLVAEPSNFLSAETVLFLFERFTLKIKRTAFIATNVMRMLKNVTICPISLTVERKNTSFLILYVVYGLYVV